jgi:hypothetical protein
MLRKKHERRFAGWWINAALLRSHHHEKIIPDPRKYAGSAVIRHGDPRIMHFKRENSPGINLCQEKSVTITPLDSTAFVVSFQDHPWSKGRVMLFSLPWDERHPLKAWLNRHCNFKRRIIEYLHERDCNRAMEEWEKTR